MLSHILQCCRILVLAFLAVALLPLSAMATDYVLPPPDPVFSSGGFTLPAGDTLTVNGGGTITNNLSAIFNHGSITNIGTITNDGVDLNNYGITSNAGGIITNQNTGWFRNHSGAVLTNSSIFTNQTGGRLDNYSGATLTNNGIIENQTDAMFYNEGGATLTNSGAIANNHSSLRNSGTLTNNAGGSIANQNTGEFNNVAGGTLNNPGNIMNDNSVLYNQSGSALTNTGTITNSASTIRNSASVANNAGGAITNQNTGLLENQSGGTLTNNGTITNDYSDIENSGTITNNTGGAITIRNLGRIFNMSGATLTNNGTITNQTEGTLQNESGATLTNNGAITNDFSDIVNYGIFTSNTGVAITNRNNGRIFNMSGATLTNSGTITIESDARLDNDGGTLINYGNIANDDGDIVNSGTLTNNAGCAISNRNSGRLFNNPGATLTNYGDISSDDSSIIDNDGGTLTNWGTITSNGTFENTGTFTNFGTLRGTGTIAGNFSNDGRIAPGNSIGTMTIDGNYTHNSTATLEVEANAAGESDRLVVTGIGNTATLNGGTVSFLPGPGSYRAGTTYTILTAAGGVVGAFDTVTGGLAFLTPSLVYGLDNVALLLTRNAISFAEAALTPNQRAVAAALDRIEAGGATGDMADVIGGLLGLSSEGAARSAFDRMGGLSHLALTEAAFSSFRRYLGAVSGRMGGSISGRLSLADGGLVRLASLGDIGSDAGLLLAAAGNALGTGQSAVRDWGFWTRGYGGIGRARGDALPENYDDDTAGLVLGFDRRMSSTLVLGFAGGYSYTSMDLSDLPESGEISSWQGSLYAAYEQGPWYVNGIAAYSHNSFESSREISFGGIGRKADADYAAHLLGGYAEAGYRIRTERVDLIPMVSFQAAHLMREGFTEEDAGALGLEVEKERETSLLGSVGVRMRKEYRAGSGTLTPELRVAWLHEFSRSDYELDARFSTAPASSFTVAGGRTVQDSALVGAGIGWERDNLNLVLALDSSLSGDQTEYNLSLGLRYRW